jgi:hypothetical protein
MANGDKPPGDGEAVAPAAEEQPFDRWLRKQLHAMFDDVVNEPLPPDLVSLIDQDAERARQEAADASPPAASPKTS